VPRLFITDWLILFIPVHNQVIKITFFLLAQKEGDIAPVGHKILMMCQRTRKRNTNLRKFQIFRPEATSHPPALDARILL
jgi:hypothetical protein